MREYENIENTNNPEKISKYKDLIIETNLNDHYSFDNLIEGDFNMIARAVGLAIAKKPGSTNHNPLIIYAGIGLGKTHIAQAIGNEIIKNNSDKTVYYLSAENFSKQFSDAVRNNEVNSFVDFYLLVEILILDDIQYLSNKSKSQEMFRSILDQFYQKGNQIIITANCKPDTIKGMEKHLSSRLKGGLIVNLSIPDLESRVSIIKSFSNKEGMNLSTEMIDFICKHTGNDIRELIGVLKYIKIINDLNEEEVDMDSVREMLK